MKTEGAVLVQYVFLDIVRFTEGRTTEAQVDVVAALNAAVIGALNTLDINRSEQIFLPTGDGLAIALLQPAVFDLALKLAKEIQKSIASHNSATEDARRRFEVRIGANQNIDNLVTDINGKTNLAGRGINHAQRVMNIADGSQVMVSESIYEILREREEYADCFRQLAATDKHGNDFNVYHLVQPDEFWLNRELPEHFKPTVRALNQYQAFYISHAVHLRDFLLGRLNEPGFRWYSTIVLHLLARESTVNLGRGLDAPSITVQRSKEGSPLPAWRALDQMEIRVIAEFARLVREGLVAEHFQDSPRLMTAFPTPEAVNRVKVERPDIWAAAMAGNCGDSKRQ